MNKLKIFLSLIAVLILTSCSCKPQLIPIVQKLPPIILPSDPVNYTKNLTLKSSPDEVIKAWVATAISYRNWNIIVRKQIGGLNK